MSGPAACANAANPSVTPPGCGPTPTPTPSPSPTAPADDEFSVSSDGWVTYTDPQSSALALSNASTATISGSAVTDAEGDPGCDFSSSGTANPPTSGTSETFQEEVGYNPTTCQERIKTGTIRASDIATLDQQDLTASVASGTAATSSQTADGTATANTVTAAALKLWKFHVKTAYIDPAFITITSQDETLTYPNTKSHNTVAVAGTYEFKYDGWSRSGPTLKLTSNTSTQAGVCDRVDRRCRWKPICG